MKPECEDGGFYGHGAKCHLGTACRTVSVSVTGNEPRGGPASPTGTRTRLLPPNSGYEGRRPLRRSHPVTKRRPRLTELNKPQKTELGRKGLRREGARRPDSPPALAPRGPDGTLDGHPPDGPNDHVTQRSHRPHCFVSKAQTRLGAAFVTLSSRGASIQGQVQVFSAGTRRPPQPRAARAERSPRSTQVRSPHPRPRWPEHQAQGGPGAQHAPFSLVPARVFAELDVDSVPAGTFKEQDQGRPPWACVPMKGGAGMGIQSER